MTSGLATKTIREIALESPASVPVFEDLKIDYCCGGNVNFEAACNAANISPKVVEEKLGKALADSETRNVTEGHQKDSPTELIGHIIAKHHKFTRESLVRLSPLMEKVSGKHGGRHPELLEVERLFGELSADLIPHMNKEEQILFPFIELMEFTRESSKTMAPPPFGTVANPIRMMMMEHDTAGSMLKEMRVATNDYELPGDACPSFTALYFGLEELEKDLHFHIHLENNVLFPQAEELENTFV